MAASRDRSARLEDHLRLNHRVGAPLTVPRRSHEQEYGGNRNWRATSNGWRPARSLLRRATSILHWSAAFDLTKLPALVTPECSLPGGFGGVAARASEDGSAIASVM
jgi:hypothetical protein